MPTVRRGAASESGFTLVELMVVIGVAAILISVLTIAVRRGSESFGLRQAATLTVSEIRRAQAAALSEHTRYAVEFLVGDPGGINVYKETDPNTWVLARAVAAPGDWPSGVAISSATTFSACGSPPGSAVNVCLTIGIFGDPQPNGQVVLESATGRQRIIVVEPATGRVRLQ